MRRLSYVGLLLACLLLAGQASPALGSPAPAPLPTPVFAEPPQVAASGVDGAVAFLPERPSFPRGPGLRGIVSSAELVGEPFAIANQADPARVADNLDAPAVTYNSRRDVYLVAWHGYERTGSYNIYARELSSAGVLGAQTINVCRADGDQANPALAYDPAADQYWAVWQDWRAGASQVYARRLSSSGLPVGEESLVSAPGQVAYAPQVVCGGGRAVITWSLDLPDSSEVYVRAYDGTGNPRGAAVRASSAGVPAESSCLAYNPADDQYLAVWDEQHEGTGWDIVGQRLGADLALAGGPITIENAAGDQALPRVAFAASGARYCVVWQDGRNGSTWAAYARFVSRLGQVQGVSLALFTGPADYCSPDVVAHSSRDEFLVVLDSQEVPDYIRLCTLSGAGTVLGRSEVMSAANHRWQARAAYRTGSDDCLAVWVESGANTQPDIAAQRVRFERSLNGPRLTVCAGPKGQERPSLAYNAKANQFLAVWQDYRDGQTYHIRGRLLSDEGALVGQELQISAGGSLHAVPQVVYQPARDEYLVVWHGIGSSGGYDVFAQRLGANGQIVGSAIHVSRNVDTAAEGYPVVAEDPSGGGYLVAWMALSAGSWNVYAQRVAADGQLVGGLIGVCVAPGEQGWPAVVRNSSNGEYLVLWEDKRNGGGGQVFGRRVAAGGALVGAEVLVCAPGGSLAGMSIAYQEQRGEYLLAWGDWGEGGRIYTRRLSASLAPLAAPLLVSSPAAKPWGPLLGYDWLGQRYLCLWHEPGSDGAADLYGVRLSAEGAPLGARLALIVRPDVQSNPSLAQNTASGQFLITWQDFWAQNWDIYGQRWRDETIPTPTPTPSRTPTPTRSPTPTRTPTPFVVRERVFLPDILRH